MDNNGHMITQSVTEQTLESSKILTVPMEVSPPVGIKIIAEEGGVAFKFDRKIDYVCYSPAQWKEIVRAGNQAIEAAVRFQRQHQPGHGGRRA
jgi:hypothetical protein